MRPGPRRRSPYPCRLRRVPRSSNASSKPWSRCCAPMVGSRIRCSRAVGRGLPVAYSFGGVVQQLAVDDQGIAGMRRFWAVSWFGQLKAREMLLQFLRHGEESAKREPP
ncbi:hypothetical protein ACFFX0_32840 [Citricoccus parietis]|uniref:LysR substrate-binding domain-containing protein n=1 Tax=Citricoccus parietis TaxID=592307 RepID=A0ABV5G9Y2_9MICC